MTPERSGKLTKTDAVRKSGWEMARLAFIVGRGREPSDREPAKVLALDKV
jgi:hypothetical protein